MMKNYKQNSPKYNRIKIRGTNLRIGQYGCLICSIANLSSYFGSDVGVQGVIDLTGFTPDGKLIWRSGLYPDFEFYKIIKGLDQNMIIDALNDPDRAVILGLNNAKHWVVATDIVPLTGNLMIADTLGKNDREPLPNGDTIDYMAFFRRKPTL